MLETKTRDFWTNFSPGTTPATTPINDNFWQYFSPNDHILEVGVAWGRIVYECLERGLRVTGIDINSAEVTSLEKKLKKEGLADKVKLHLGSATQIPLNSNLFEGVFLQGLLSALTLNQRHFALKEAFRVLKPNGYIHVAEFELNEIDAERKLRYQNDLKVTGEYGTLVVRGKNQEELFRTHNFKESELRNLIVKAGFEIIEIKKERFPTFKNKVKPGIIIIATKASN